MKAKNKNWNCKITLLCVLFLSLLFSSYSAPWEDLNQNFRQEINFSGASSSITNLTYELAIDSSLIGSNFNFSEDRDSLRFYYFNISSGSNTLIAHYVQEWNEIGESGVVLIKIPLLRSTENTSIWAYYGDSGKINNEEYCDVFIYCDLFEDSSLDSSLNTVDLDTVAGTNFNETSGVLSIVAGGSDTWTGSDQYGSVYLNNIEGDVDIRVTIDSSTSPNSWTKAGIMVKNDMTLSGSSTGYSFVVRTPGNGYSFQRDINNNGFLEASSTAGSPSTSPSHVRLVKEGTSHTGYYSKTTQDSWNLFTSTTITSTNNIADIGLSLTSHAGSTLATATFDNFTIRRFSADTINGIFGVEETKPSLQSIIIEPSILKTTNIIQNNTFNVNISIECAGVSIDCSNVTGTLQYNNSGIFENISDTQAMPFWSITQNTKYCIIISGDFCIFSWIINTTGSKNSLNQIRGIFSSNDSRISKINTSTFSIKSVIGNTMSFNVSNYVFNDFLKNSGDKTINIDIIADNGNNSNISMNCISGDCIEISHNFVNGINLSEGSKQITQFTCDDSKSGFYTALFSLTSDEFDGNSTLNVECNVLPIFGPLVGTITNPNNDIAIGQNRTFSLISEVNCTGTCGEITALAQYFGDLTIYKRNLEIEISDPVPIDYQVLLELNGTLLGPNFNWSLSCADIRFESISNQLDYYIEHCNTGSEELSVWVKMDTVMPKNSNYSMTMYYGNSSAISQSSATDTFRPNEIHLTTGRCLNGVTGCNHLDNVGEGEYIRENINSTGLEIDGTGYVSQINNPNNPYGSDDYFFMRYRALYIPASSGNFSFGVASDDGANVGLWNKDGYGYGLSTPSSLTSVQDIVSDWYGGHGSGTCGSSLAIERTREIHINTPYWVDYLMEEGNGGQDAEFCIDTGSGYNNFGTGSFTGEFFARTYVENEPSLSNVGSEKGEEISTVLGATPFYTTSMQPQTCSPVEDGNCTFTWIINGTGPINSSWDINILYSSNISLISNTLTPSINVNISDNIIPEIVLLSPNNNTKIIHNKNMTLIWQINDDDPILISEIYLNGILNTSLICISGNNCSITLNLDSNRNTWQIRTTDSKNNTASSEIRTLYSIEDFYAKYIKNIYYLNSNIYSIELSTQNKVNFSRKYSQLSFISNTYNFGSLTRINNLSLLSPSPYLGTILTWNLFIEKNQTLQTNYSITNNVANPHLLDEFIISG